MKIAVIGSGISGLTAAYQMRKTHDVHVFEAARSAGGHSHTVKVLEGDLEIPVDTGFIVYNEITYPGFASLLHELEVSSTLSEMSFGLSCTLHNLEYSSRGIIGMLAQPAAMLRPENIRMAVDIKRFNRESNALIDETHYPEESLGEFLNRHDFGSEFRRHYIVPLVGAIWSTPPNAVPSYPAKFLFKFLRNHGLLSFTGRHIWRTVKGGSQQYVNKLVERLPNGVRVGTAVTSVCRGSDHVSITLRDGQTHQFDRVVFACHSDQTLALLNDGSPTEKQALANIRYEPSKVVLHTDSKVMPRRKRAWASWNFTTDACADLPVPASVSYHMNRLQRFDAVRDYFVTVNPKIELDPERVIEQFVYSHPQYTQEMIKAQGLLRSINGLNQTHFAGAYLGHGFHEDGFRSGQSVAADLGHLVESHVLTEAIS